ncbi:hypothetical protein SAMD00019534_054030 [Acytostelium subglobosum LB1]|uniref:hypothetical protein n=1 Tax=Acytostelium subglobosum LB1 TaxID=1410327 RepID=UPI000644E77F|nr:hypothetical protein SAMD00019534_054030 [Acytostelium subglobosum LB1]GAM22228.1 hypothetical protein SAMD00019534_054030 [Acytostelium subglobosum LB1]|eukprot:XP_012755328.1 hypothetical protein SAMD00019534_054030 [Acytostelium subglobosum LB1]
MSADIPTLTVTFTMEGNVSRVDWITMIKSFPMTDLNVITRNGNVTIFQVCGPIILLDDTSKCGAETGGPNPAVCPLTIGYVHGNGTSMIIQPTFTNMTVLFDITPPSLTNITLANTDNMLYLKLGANDTESGIGSALVQVSPVGGGRIVSINFPSSSLAADGYYYATFSPGENLVVGVNWRVARVFLFDNAANKWYTDNQTFITSELGLQPFQFNNGVKFNYNIGSVDSANVSTDLFEDCTVVQPLTFNLTLKDFGQDSMIKTLTASFSEGFTANCQYYLWSWTFATIYCSIPPFNVNGTHSINIQYSNFKGNSGSQTLTQTITYINNNFDPISNLTHSFNVEKIDNSEDFYLTWNITFSQTNSYFRVLTINGLYDPGVFSQNHLVDGGLHQGTLSKRIFILANKYNLTEFSGTVETTNGISSTFTGNGPMTTLRPNAANNLIIPSKVTLSNYNVNLSSTANTVAMDVTLNTVRPLANFNLESRGAARFNMLSYQYYPGKRGFVDGTQNVGHYFSVLKNGGYSGIKNGGSYFSTYGSMYSESYTYKDIYLTKCLTFTGYPSEYKPIITALTVSPSNAIDVTASSQLVKLMITVANPTVPANSFSVSLNGGPQGTPVFNCINISTIVTSTSYECSVTFPKQFISTSLDFGLNFATSLYTSSVTAAQLYTMGLPSHLTIVGKPTTTISQPTISNLDVQMAQDKLSFNFVAADAPIYKVEVYIFDTFIGKGHLIGSTSYSTPIDSAQVSISLRSICNQFSVELAPLGVSLVITDSNRATYTYPWLQLQSMFPTFTWPAYGCDTSPPILQSIEKSSPIFNTTDAGATATVKIHVTDQSGIAFFKVSITPFTDSTNYTYTMDATTLVEGNSRDGVYQLTFNIPRYTSKSFYLSIPIMIDVKGNYITYTAADIITGVNKDAYIYAQSSMPPPTSPSLTSQSANYNVYLGQTFNLSMVVSNDVTTAIMDVFDVGLGAYVRVQQDVSIPGNVLIRYTPTTAGEHYYVITLVGSGLQVKTYNFNNGMSPFYFIQSQAPVPQTTTTTSTSTSSATSTTITTTTSTSTSTSSSATSTTITTTTSGETPSASSHLSPVSIALILFISAISVL